MTLLITIIDGESRSAPVPLAEFLEGKGLPGSLLVHESQIRPTQRLISDYRRTGPKHQVSVQCNTRVSRDRMQIVVGKQRFTCQVFDKDSTKSDA